MDVGGWEDVRLPDVLGGDGSHVEPSACDAGVGSLGGRCVLLLHWTEVA